MAPLVRLRVTSEILAVPAAYHHGFVKIAAGSIIETAADLAEPGLHHVSFDGKDLLVFARDILERTEKIQTMDSVPSS